MRSRSLSGDSGPGPLSLAGAFDEATDPVESDPLRQLKALAHQRSLEQIQTSREASSIELPKEPSSRLAYLKSETSRQ